MTTSQHLVRRARPALVCVIALVAGLAVSVEPATAQQSGGVRVAAPAAGNDPLPVQRITLYRSGVGYFEHGGLVAGDRPVAFSFGIEQVNDILKSMVILDQAGGTATVGYGSKAPLTKRLASFGVNIADNPSLSALLGRLRGAAVRLATADGPVEGTVLGVESRQIPVTGGGGTTTTLMTDQFINLVTTTGLRSVATSRVASVELMDKELAAELNLALAALAEQRNEKSASVELRFSAGPERPVRVGYVHETPVWKTTYRLVLPDETEGDLTLQGWAIVENTTDRDWKDVRLSLASGQPVAFRMDLHEPLFVARPEVAVPAAAFGRVRTYEGNLLANLAKQPAAAMAQEAAGRRDGAVASARARVADDAQEKSQVSFDAFEVYDADAMNRYAPRAMASGGEAGEQFRYDIGVPVTIERQRSAMLPIVAAPVKGERLSIFNPADGGRNPMRGVEMKNTSGLELAPGPIAVFDGGAYAGDAQIGFTSRGQDRLLAYAVDLDVEVEAEPTHTSDVRKLVITNGLVRQESKLVRTTKYSASNRDAKRGRTVLIEHPRDPSWTLVSEQKPRSEAAGVYRFAVKADPMKAATLSVVEERTEWTSYAVTDYPLQSLLTHAQRGKASQKVVDAVKKAAEMQGQINQLVSRIAELDRRRDAITVEQGRIRSNMGSVDRQSELWSRYAKKLGEQETELESIHVERAESSERLDAARAALNDYLKSLSVE